jgi:hypothetical protein
MYLGLDISAVTAAGDLDANREDLKSFYAAAGTTAGERFNDDDLTAMITAADADGFVQYNEFESLLAGRATHAPVAAAGGAGIRWRTRSSSWTGTGTATSGSRTWPVTMAISQVCHAHLIR